jgi:hypothetical protein
MNPVEAALGSVCGKCARENHRRICQQTDGRANVQEFARKYRGRRNLHAVPWQDFSEELQAACQRFIDEWFKNTDIDDARELSGFNDMSVKDLLRYAMGKLPDESDVVLEK